jgi:hypothetical protein
LLNVPRSWSEMTPAWMTAALVGSFPGAVVGDVEIGEVAGGTNRRARVRLGYRSGGGPESVFVKREGRLFNRLALTALGALEAEAHLFASGVRLPLEHPAPYAAAVDRRRLSTVVVMENVTLRSARPNAATVPLSVGQVRSGLSGLARLHAAFWDRPLPASLGFLRPWTLGLPWAPVSWASLAWALQRLRSGGHGAVIPTDLDATILERRFRAWAATAATGPQTVLHGDPHPGNTYALPGETTGFYDWQLVRTGNWSHDVGYFLTSSLDVASRRAHERNLLGDYLEELGKRGVAAPGFADAWHLYRQTPAFGLSTWLHTFSGRGFQPVEVCLATIERFAVAYDDLEQRF